jgi:hypothetical protein
VPNKLIFKIFFGVTYPFQGVALSLSSLISCIPQTGMCEEGEEEREISLRRMVVRKQHLEEWIKLVNHIMCR